MSTLENNRNKNKSMVLVTLGTSRTMVLFPLNLWNWTDYSQFILSDLGGTVIAQTQYSSRLQLG